MRLTRPLDRISAQRGYGAIEIVGGLIAGSQALKADALDFIGDGTISFLGLIAVGWGLAPRAKAAMPQGIFLGLWEWACWPQPAIACSSFNSRKRN